MRIENGIQLVVQNQFCQKWCEIQYGLVEMTLANVVWTSIHLHRVKTFLEKSFLFQNISDRIFAKSIWDNPFFCMANHPLLPC